MGTLDPCQRSPGAVTRRFLGFLFQQNNAKIPYEVPILEKCDGIGSFRNPVRPSYEIMDILLKSARLICSLFEERRDPRGTLPRNIRGVGPVAVPGSEIWIDFRIFRGS